jgi:anti-anti-sigma factor
MSTDFILITELHNKTLVLKTNGYINDTAGKKIVEEFTKHFNGGITKVIMDLEKSNVVNSIGISHIIDIVEKLMDINGKLIFTNLDPSIKQTFKTMGLFQFAEIADSVDSALQ